MRCILVSCLLVLSLSFVQAEHKLEEEKSDITKLDVIELGEAEDANNEQHSESQAKRDSGYSYNRPDRFPSANRNRFHGRPAGFKGKVVTRHPSQVSRPFNMYGPPNQQNSPATKPSNHGQQHRDKLHHFGNDHSNGMFNQEIPSPIRHYDFVEASPIASQNNEPFGLNTANYLPPRNQKLPAYSAPASVNVPQGPPSFQDQGQGLSDLRSQSLINSPVNQISDAAVFLAQNAQAIEQLYGSPASNQDFAPQNDEFQDQSNQIQNPNAQFQTLESTSPNPQAFQPPIPSYASGTLDNRETLERIQSLEKDRLIQQLQQALATQSQSQNVELLGRYAENQAGLTQNHNILSSAGPQFPNKFHSATTPQSSVAFDQSFFLPGSTFAFGYRPTTTTQAPTTSTNSVTGVSLQPGQSSKGDGSVQVGTSLPAPSQPGSSVPSVSGIPLYGGFVPTFVTGTNFFNLPTYGSGVLTPGTASTSVQSSGTSPTHFGIPIPTEQGKKPSQGTPSTPPSTVPAGSHPQSHPAHPVHVPVQPFHPVVPLQPAATPVHPVSPLQPAATPVHPVSPLQPAATPVHPVTPLRPAAAHPTYGVQPSVVNPLLYKPIKAVYPVYYYPNVAYQLQKPALPTYPWSYAPAYAQAKPAQIWK